MTAAERPGSLEAMRDALHALVTREGAAKAAAFEPAPDDLILSPFSKCGTTWLQQIVHTLRTRGDMDFDDISRVVPWIEMSPDLGLDLEAPQRGTPRAFKSHLGYDRIPKGARYIVSFRDPRDALVSQFRFLEGWWFEPGAIDLESFARGRFLAERAYWHHLRSWWEQRARRDVLLLCFEDLVDDLETAVERIAAFAGIALDAELRALTLEHASFAFMKRHGDRFDDRLMRERSERVCGLPRGSDSTKVRTGTVGSHRREASASLLRDLDAVWAEEIEATTGLRDYAALRSAVGAGTVPLS